MTFSTQDSGKRKEFDTGAVRDIEDGKPRYGLIPVEVLTRDAELLGRGAAKYDDWNWAKGMPFQRTFESMIRHAYQWYSGDKSEDHLAAVRFGAMCLMYFEMAMAAGELPASLDDRRVIGKSPRDAFDAAMSRAMRDVPLPFDAVGISPHTPPVRMGDIRPARPVPPPPAPETEVTFGCGCNRMPGEGEYCSQHNIGVSHAG